MAGIGVTLNKIYGKNTLTTNMVGVGYSVLMTIAPMMVVMGALLLMEYLLGFSELDYTTRELFSCTVLYTFIFSLITAAPFNSILSRYISDVIYNEKYEDIIPCYKLGLFMNTILTSILGIVFCIHEHVVGGVPIYYVFTGYCGYIALMFVFYSMLYLSIFKDYKKLALYYIFGMVVTVILSLIFVKLIGMETTYGMLLAMCIGFWIIAVLEYSLIRTYFREDSRNYKGVFPYFRNYWPLILTNTFYILGLFSHNFVFWTTPMRLEIVKSFVCMQPYDMASCLAMFTNISATVIFISRVEMKFHERYKLYSEAVIGGRGIDIANAKRRMFRLLGEELMSLVRVQFIISLVIYLLCIIFLPQFGFGGMTLRIYPSLAAGYFILFIMYSEIIFLYYFNDLVGSVYTSLSFLIVTIIGSFYATQLSDIWYGLGVILGSLTGFVVAYLRLRYMERNLDDHVFCRGNLMPRKVGRRPSGKTFDRYTGKTVTKEN